MAEQDKIRLEIVTPDKQVFHAMVAHFTVPAAAGSTGIFYNHAPLITVLAPGIITYVKDDCLGKVAVGKGFLEVRDNEAEILVDSAELAENIDVARALSAAERARRRLAERSANVDILRAQASLTRALNRLKAKGEA